MILNALKQDELKEFNLTLNCANFMLKSELKSSKIMKHKLSFHLNFHNDDLFGEELKGKNSKIVTLSHRL